MSTNKTSLGQFLRELRKEKGETLHEVSMGTDIDSPLLSKIERGERLPTSEQLKKLSRFYNVAEASLNAKLAAEKIVKVYGLNDTTYDAIRLVEEQLVEYGKKPSKTDS